MADALLLALIRIWGHEVHVARTATQAVEAVQTHPPDVVLVEVMPHTEDGYRLAWQLGEREECRGAALITVGDWTEEAGDRRRQPGFSAHLTRPVAAGALWGLFLRLAEEKSSAVRPDAVWSGPG
jgi:CheY-like chemotaxis protein